MWPVRVNALIRVPATTGIMAREKIGWPFPPCATSAERMQAANQRVVADLVQRRKPEMAGVLAHFDRSTCLDETVLERNNQSYNLIGRRPVWAANNKLPENVAHNAPPEQLMLPILCASAKPLVPPLRRRPTRVHVIVRIIGHPLFGTTV